MILPIETRTIEQLPEAAIVDDDTYTVIQMPGAPMQKVRVGLAFNQFLAVATAKQTKALLDADLAYPENTIALVYADPTAGLSGYYRKLGAPGAGGWSLINLTKGGKGDPGGNVESLGTYADVAAEPVAIPAGTRSVRLSGYQVAGDGGAAVYVETAAEPAHPGKFQAADGRWFAVSSEQPITPEKFGAIDRNIDQTAKVQAAMNFAAATIGRLDLQAMYLIGGELKVPQGLTVAGPRSSGFKRIDQVRHVATAAATAISGDRFTVPVDSVEGFAVGQAVMAVWNGGGSVLPSNPYSHVNPYITAINAGTKTLTVHRNGNVGTPGAGATIQTAGHMVIADGDTILQGFTIDGNSANQVEGYWVAMEDLTLQGDRCSVHGLHIKNSYSDGILVGGPIDGFISDIKITGCTLENIGANGIHFGNAYKLLVQGNTFKGCNKLNAGLNVAHQDGACIFSNGCWDLNFTGNDVEDALFGAGAFGTTAAPIFPVDQINDQVIVVGNNFHNCFRSVDILLQSRRIVVGLNRMSADYDPAGAPYHFANGRFLSHAAVWIEGDVHGSVTQDILIALNQIRNGTIAISYSRNVDCMGNQFDNREIRDIVDLRASYQIFNSRDIKVEGGRVIGGVTGLYMQSSYAVDDLSGYGFPLGRMRRIRVKGVEFLEQIASAVEPLVANDNGELEATIEGCGISDIPIQATVASQAAMLALDVPVGAVVRRTDAAANYWLKALPATNLANWVVQSWIGIRLSDRVKALRNSIDHAAGTAIVGTSRRLQNTQGNTINGIIAGDYAAFVPYVSTYHAFVASANGAVVGAGADVYSATVTSGAADTWRNVAHTATYADEVATIRVVPRSAAADYRGGAGFTDLADASGGDPFNDLDYQWRFFNGQALVAEGANNRTAGVAYAAGDVFWVVRTAANAIEYWKGGDGVTYDTGVKVHTHLFEVPVALRGKVVIRNGAGAIEVKMFG